jgi:phosphate transport system permease protein
LTVATIDTLDSGRAGGAGDLAEAGGAAGPVAPVRKPRRIRRTPAFSTDDWLSLGGALLASYALVYVGYDHLLDFSGLFGFGICWYLMFLLVYAGVVAAAHPRTIVVERLVSATLYLVAGVVIFALGSTVVYTFAKGWHAFVHVNFFTHDMAGVAPTAPLTQGGILHALVGTAIEIAIAVAISVPLGIGTAVFMTEVGGRGVQLVRTVVEAMTALAEILAGLFVYTVLIVFVGLPKSGLAVSIAMAVTMVPIIARAGEVALRVVPGGLREAGSALGSNHWRTVWKVVLPSARTGLATATILAIARGIGETAIPLVTSGASSFTTFNPTSQPMNSLPLFIYSGYTTHEPLEITRAFGAASVLLTLVLLLFVVTRALLRDRSVRR